jgi:hypothetical protein
VKAERLKRKVKGKNGGTLIPFVPGESGNPAGSKKSHLKLLKEELEVKYDFNISTKDVKDLLKLLVFAPKDELEKLKNNPNTPVIILNYITALYSDIKKGQINAAKDLIEIEFGKSIQKFEDATPQKPLDISDITPDKLYETTAHILTMLEVDYLEKLQDLIEKQINIRRSNNAKIIEN